MTLASRFARFAAVAAAVVGLAACSADVNPRGNAPAPERVSQIQPGETGRNEVRALLGSPSTTSTFGGETWYYISARTQQWAYRATEELERQVLAVSFGPDGTVSEVRTMDKADGRDIEIVERQTPTPGNEETILQQLLGNVGRFAKGN